MTLYFLLNPSQPRLRKKILGLAQKVVRAQNHTAYFGDVNRLEADSMAHHVERALQHQCTRIVAIGGDGTYSRLMRILATKNQLDKMEIGMVPGGTCNDFVRALGLSSRRLTHTLRFACSAPAIATDLGELNGDVFLNNAGFGRRRMPVQRRRINAFGTLRQFEAVPLRATWDGGTLAGDFFMGIVCNSPFFSKGLHFAKDVRIDDGWLDIFLVPKMPKAKLAAMLVLGRFGRSLHGRQFVRLRLKGLTIESERDLWPQVDGEPPTPHPVHQLCFRISSTQARIVRPV